MGINWREKMTMTIHWLSVQWPHWQWHLPILQVTPTLVPYLSPKFVYLHLIRASTNRPNLKLAWQNDNQERQSWPLRPKWWTHLHLQRDGTSHLIEPRKQSLLQPNEVCDMWQIPQSWGDSRPMTACWGTTGYLIPCLLTHYLPVPRHNADTSLPRCLQHPMVGIVPYPWQIQVTPLFPLTVYLDMKEFHPKWLWTAPKNKT